ncbi:ATP-binding protein, partial [Cobetia marina]
QALDEDVRRSFHAVLGTAEEASEDESLIQSSETVERVVRVLHLVIEKSASLRPLVMMIDDLQWLDEPSLKVLAGLQARLPINIGFMLAASHNGRDSLAVKLNWDQHISLGRLDPMQVSRLLSHLSRRYRLHLSPRMRSQLIERCDGVPLYLQEICRRLDMDRREGRPVQLDELPKGLIGLLSSRIDQLEEGRDVAHAAAVLGRVFKLSFLRQSCEFEEGRLKRSIESMQRLEIIEACGNDSEFDYQFTHQLIQEAAYLSCPRDVRRRIHLQVVALIEDKHPAWISRHPGYFAVHLRKSQ